MNFLYFILILAFVKKYWYRNLAVRRHIFLTEKVEKDKPMWRNLNNEIPGHEAEKITV